MHSMQQQKFTKIVLVLLAILLALLYLFRGAIFDNVFDGIGKSQASPEVQKTINDSTQSWLAKQEYNGEQQIFVNEDKPDFKSSELKIDDGSWQKLSNRDLLARPQEANALLNKSLMPTKKREPLTVKTPGYKVYKFDANGVQTYLYNRSHLIGYQLTGENNNPANLVTGTVALNATHESDNQASMETYENQVATYLRQDKNHYVRYRVTPIYRNIERVPRGVEMEAQSVTDGSISFNVYIFNAQPGWKINYYTGSAIQNVQQ